MWRNQHRRDDQHFRGLADDRAAYGFTQLLTSAVRVDDDEKPETIPFSWMDVDAARPRMREDHHGEGPDQEADRGCHSETNPAERRRLDHEHGDHQQNREVADNRTQNQRDVPLGRMASPPGDVVQQR